jgi:hypothetical protein
VDRESGALFLGGGVGVAAVGTKCVLRRKRKAVEFAPLLPAGTQASSVSSSASSSSA